MAYSTDNPPFLTSQGVGGSFRRWAYKSNDAPAVVRVDGYITNAEDLGMKVNDVVEVVDVDGQTVSLCTVRAINANGSADLSDGTALTQTDTD